MNLVITDNYIKINVSYSKKLKRGTLEQDYIINTMVKPEELHILTEWNFDKTNNIINITCYRCFPVLQNEKLFNISLPLKKNEQYEIIYVFTEMKQVSSKGNPLLEFSNSANSEYSYKGIWPNLEKESGFVWQNPLHIKKETVRNNWKNFLKKFSIL